MNNTTYWVAGGVAAILSLIALSKAKSPPIPAPTGKPLTPQSSTAFNFFVSKGLTEEQSAGVVGNLIAESNLNPGIAGLEKGGYYAHGIAQWGRPRWSSLKSWAAKSGYDANDLVTQLGYVWVELNSIPAFGLSQLRSASDVNQAALIFEKMYERPAAGSSARRVELARNVFNTYARRA